MSSTIPKTSKTTFSQTRLPIIKKRSELQTYPRSFSVLNKKENTQSEKKQKIDQLYLPFEKPNTIQEKEPANSNDSGSSSWSSYRLAALDIEGTGAQDKDKEEILEVAAVIIENGQVTNKIFHSLINPQRRFTEHPWVYLKNNEVINAPNLDQVKPGLENFLNGTVLFAHNARVDWNILNLKGVKIAPLAVIDTLAIAKKFYSKPHSLEKLADRFKLNGLIRENGQEIQPHRALYDAHATAFLTLEIIKTLPNNMTLKELVTNYGVKGAPQPK